VSQRSDGTQEREDPKQRLDRELIELLNELRVALPRVQMLFAFLLTMPLSSRFGDLTSAQRVLYFGTLLSTAIGAAFLMTPTAYHRLRFRASDKERLLRVSNRAAVTSLDVHHPLGRRCRVLDRRSPLPFGPREPVRGAGHGRIRLAVVRASRCSNGSRTSSRYPRSTLPKLPRPARFPDRSALRRGMGQEGRVVYELQPGLEVRELEHALDPLGSAYQDEAAAGRLGPDGGT
jgi:hypothetical protein